MSYEEHLKANYLREFLKKILKYWNGGPILEIGTGTGYLSIYLSKNRIDVKAVDNDEDILEKCRFSNNILEGSAEFIYCDAFELSSKFKDEEFDVVFHQGLFEHFSDEDITRLLEEQFKIGKYVLFSVPSKYYPQKDFGDERLMDKEAWLQILSSYNKFIIEIEYHGHTEGSKEHLFFAIRSPYFRLPSVKRRIKKSAVIKGRRTKPEIVWESLIFHPSGYAAIARNTVIGLDYIGLKVCLNPMTLTVKMDYDLETVHKLIHMIENKPSGNSVYVFHHPPAGFKGEDFFTEAIKRNSGMKRYIGSTMFETDRIPPMWVSACNKMDEIWVPTKFNLETFSRSGVSREKIKVIPFGIDPKLFTKRKYEKISFPGNKGFNFISVFEWTKRKGWDILLKAYLTEFDYREDVALNLFVYRGSGTDLNDKESISVKAYRYITEVLGIDPYRKPHLNIIEAVIPYHEMPGIYFSADAFVLSSRGEGWGMPYMEAMTAGLPTIATRWSGQLQFMNDENSYLIDIDGLSPVDSEQIKDNRYYEGHKWAEPSVTQTKKLMRKVFTDRKEAQQKGEYAKYDILNNWTIINTAHKIEKRVMEIIEEESKTRIPVSVNRNMKIDEQIVWNSPVFDISGYAEEARNLILGLYEYSDIDIKLKPVNWSNIKSELDEKEKHILERLIENEEKKKYINLYNIFPSFFERNEKAVYNIGRTLFETDRIPGDWVDKCNEMDEIWVPSDFNIDTFSKSGVIREKLYKIPECLEPEKFDPGLAPLYIPEKKEFNFISIFDWSLRKGWDVLLRAFIEEFSPDEEVSLTLKTYSSYGLSGEDIQEIIVDFIRNRLKRELEKAPRVILISKLMSEKELLQFYRTGDAFVLPSRGEGWGRPLMEAMAMGLPVIGTRWSGNLEFMNDRNSYLIDCSIVNVSKEAVKEVSYFEGHKWAEPSVEHLKKTMRFIFENYDKAMEKGKIARDDIINKFSRKTVANLIQERLDFLRKNNFKVKSRTKNYEIKSGKIAGKKIEKPSVVWEGSQFVYHSFGLVNREMCSALIGLNGCNLSIKLYEKHEFDSGVEPVRLRTLENYFGKKFIGKPDFWIKHKWPPDFNRPETKYWIVIQPWEYGSLPRNWIEPMNNTVDELWVPSSFVKKCYIESGINPDKIFVIPDGVNTSIFNPYREPLELNTDKSFKFLFVGGSIWRKGIDVLLKVYTSLFSKHDDVCLVIKDMGQDTFYKGQGAVNTIKKIMKDKNSAEIIYIDKKLTENQIAGLYTACNCLVHPYRGEGFGLPVAEAMACGLPVIVTKGGACDDFCTDEIVYWVSSSRKEVEIKEKLIGQGWVLEPDPGELAVQMKKVVDNYEEAREKGERAEVYVRNNLTWKISAEKIIERFQEVLNKMEQNSKSDLIKKEAENGKIDPDKFLEEARELFENGRLEDSYKKYEELYKLKPDNSEVLLGYGAVSFKLKKLEEAERLFKEGIKLFPENPEFYNNIGCVMFQKGRYDEAEKNFRESIKLDSENLNAEKNFANFLLQTGKYREVIPVCENILNKYPDEIETMVILGNCCYYLNFVDEAIKLYEKALSISPDFEDARVNLELVRKKLEYKKHP